MTQYLTEREVRGIAEYARIGLTDEELSEMTVDLNNIIDQGERSYDFEFNFSSAKERELCAEAESRLAHQPPYALSFFPTGNGKACAEFGSVSNPAVTLSAIRSSYDGKNKIVRLYNSLETPAETEIFLPFSGNKEKV